MLPFTRAMFMDGSKFCAQFLKRVTHPRNIPVKLFQNWTSGFREDFLKISSCLYSARSPHSPEPCL